MSMTYEELKLLSDKEKIKELKKLAAKYDRDGKPYFPAMATALSGSVIAVANMYNRLVEGKKVGRPKSKKTETKEKAESTSVTKIEIEDKSHTKQASKDADIYKNNKFELKVEGVFDGESAKDRMSSISNFFYADASYKITLNIEEI